MIGIIVTYVVKHNVLLLLTISGDGSDNDNDGDDDDDYERAPGNYNPGGQVE